MAKSLEDIRALLNKPSISGRTLSRNRNAYLKMAVANTDVYLVPNLLNYPEVIALIGDRDFTVLKSAIESGSLACVNLLMALRRTQMFFIANANFILAKVDETSDPKMMQLFLCYLKQNQQLLNDRDILFYGVIWIAYARKYSCDDIASWLMSYKYVKERIAAIRAHKDPLQQQPLVCVSSHMLEYLRATPSTSPHSAEYRQTVILKKAKL